MSIRYYNIMNYNKHFRKDNKGNFKVSKFEFQFG